jgi:hypothetical protein
MRARIGYRTLALFLLLVANTQINAACVDRTQLAHSIVGIMRHFDETDGRPDLIGIRATGWFLSPTTIVTAEHVTVAMKLSTADWKPLELLDGDGSQFVAARVQRLVGGLGEKLAVIELQSAVPSARSVAIRKEPLVPEEQVVTLAYRGGARVSWEAGLFDLEMMARSPARRSWKFMKATTALSSITAPPARRWLIAPAGSRRSSVTCSPKASFGRPAK